MYFLSIIIIDKSEIFCSFVTFFLVNKSFLITSSVVQSRICAVWFKDKELAFAFGCILAFSRLVSHLMRK